MALVARLPFALAPKGTGSVFFAFTVMLGMGKWQFALTAVLLEGINLILLTESSVKNFAHFYFGASLGAVN